MEFLKQASSSFLMPGVPHLIVREGTLHTLLDMFRQSGFESVFQRAGEAIGYSFGKDMIGFLLDNGKIPHDEETLTAIWTWLDTNARWGEFQIELDKKNQKMIVLVKDSFLVRGLTHNKHRFCPLMAGYVFAVTWELFKRWNRKFSEEYASPGPCLEPISVNEEKLNGTCKFTLTLRNEELIKSFDLFYAAEEAFVSSNFQQCAASLRSSLEKAFKQKIGFNLDDSTSLTILLRAFKDCGIHLPQRSIKDAFDFTSRIVHDSSYDEEGVLRLLTDTAEALVSIEKLELSEEQKVTLRNRVLELKTTRQVGEPS